MTQPTIFVSSRGFFGFGSEAVHGTAVPSSVYLPFLSESFNVDPGIILDKLIRAARDEQFNPAVGEQKVEGKLDTLLWLDQTLMPMGAAIGSDAFITCSAAGTAITLGASYATASGPPVTVTITTQTTPPIAANDLIQIQQAVGTPGVSNQCEIHKVATVSGAGPYTLTLATGEVLQNTYTSAGQISRIASGSTGFVHNLYPDVPNATFYKTLTIEKNLAGLASQQFAGSVVSKATLKGTTKDTARVSYDFVAGTYGTIAQSTPTFLNTTPLSLTNYSVSLFGTPNTVMTSLELDINNEAKQLWTFNNITTPAVAYPGGRMVSGKWTTITQDLTMYNNSLVGTTGALVFTLTQGAQSIAFTMPEAVIKKLSFPLKIGEALIYDVEYDAVYNQTSGNSISAVATLTNIYLPLC